MERTLLSAIAAMMAMALPAQVKYHVEGNAPTSYQKVYVLDIAKRYAPIDSAEVMNGKFTLEGVAGKEAVLGVGSQRSALLFFNDGTPIKADLQTNTLKGSPLNEKLNGYDRELDQYNNQLGELQAQAMSGLADQKVLRDKAMAIYEQMEVAQKRIIRENKDNLIPAAFIGDVAYSLSYEELEELCNPQNAYANHPVMALPKRLLESLAKRAPGKMYTDMALADMDGKEHKLSEWCGKGQFVMIDFWASWCGPCRQEMPNVVENYKKYHAKGFEIIGISFDQTAEPWKKAVEQMGMEWPQLSDLKGWKAAAVGIYGINSIPASILLDGTGKIVALNLRGEKLGQKLKEIYGF